MVVGAVLAGGAYLLASQVHSFTPMLGAYLLLGVGIGAAKLLPAARWYRTGSVRTGDWRWA